MAIKAGQIIHDAMGFVVDRIQTGGVGNLNIPLEKIYELGNFQTVATVRDIPDLSFEMESLDASTEIEALLQALDPTTVVAGQTLDFVNAKPLDIISPFKAATGVYSIVKGIALPYLTLENATYRFGTNANGTQAYTLRGDGVYYIPGAPYYQQYTGNGVTTVFAFANTALPYVEPLGTRYALGVCVVYSDGTYARLFPGTDYTETSAGITLTTATLAPTGSRVRVIYGSATLTTYPQTVHQDVTVKPAAIRAKDVDVYIGAAAATPVLTRWTDVQSFEVTRRVTLDNDEEFGNPHYVAQDYDVADVDGTIVVRPRNTAALFEKLHQIANVPTNEVIGPLSSVPLAVELRVNHPDTGARVKTLYIPDARFTLPGVQGRVQQKTEVSFAFSSDGGTLKVYPGARP